MIMIPVAEPLIGEKEKEYVRDCMESGWISSMGKYVPKFEEEFSRFCNTKYGISTCNGTTALHLALLVLDIKPQDEVIVPTLTFVATANVVRYTGATCVFVDSEDKTWNMDISRTENKINSKTKAIIAVHLYGHPVDMDPIIELCKTKNIALIEDAAEAHGALYKGKVAGSMGDMGCFSFYGNKIITTGEGGMITTNNPEFAEKAKALRDHGMSPERRYWHPVIGYNYRMTNIQAAIGCGQLERIDEFIKKKREIAEKYNEFLKGIAGIVLPPEAEWAKNVYWMYSILIEDGYGIDRDTLAVKLKEAGIDSRPFFCPIHLMPPYYSGQLLPVAERLSRQGINLPSGVKLTEDDIARVCQTIIKIMKRG